MLEVNESFRLIQFYTQKISRSQTIFLYTFLFCFLSVCNLTMTPASATSGSDIFVKNSLGLFVNETRFTYSRFLAFYPDIIRIFQVSSLP